MRRLSERLNLERAATTAWFDAWLVEEGEALEGLINLVLAETESTQHSEGRNSQGGGARNESGGRVGPSN